MVGVVDGTLGSDTSRSHACRLNEAIRSKAQEYVLRQIITDLLKSMPVGSQIRLYRESEVVFTVTQESNQYIYEHETGITAQLVVSKYEIGLMIQGLVYHVIANMDFNIFLTYTPN